jgi:hypothetical protein
MKDYSYRETEIEQYLDGQLDASARRAFEADMESDPELADLVALHRDERKLLELYQTERLRQLYREHQHAQKDRITQGKPFSRQNGLRILAIVILLGIAGWLLYFLNNQKHHAAPPKEPVPQADSLPVAKNKPLDVLIPNVNQPEKQPDTKTAQVRKALLAIADARAEMGYFPRNLRSNGLADTSRFTRAEYYFLNNDPDSALIVLQNLTSADSLALREFVWLRAHVYYKEGYYQKAAEDFDWLSQPPLPGSIQFYAHRLAAQWNAIRCLIQLLPDSQQELRARIDALRKNPDLKDEADAFARQLRRLE